jgi:hypothetical protein
MFWGLRDNDCIEVVIRHKDVAHVLPTRWKVLTHANLLLYELFLEASRFGA